MMQLLYRRSTAAVWWWRWRIPATSQSQSSRQPRPRVLKYMET
jgi:hypothetical protein